MFTLVNEEFDLRKWSSGLSVFCAELKIASLSLYGRISLTHFVEDTTFEMVNIRNSKKKNVTLQKLNKHDFTNDYIYTSVPITYYSKSPWTRNQAAFNRNSPILSYDSLEAKLCS